MKLFPRKNKSDTAEERTGAESLNHRESITRTESARRREPEEEDGNRTQSARIRWKDRRAKKKELPEEPTVEESDYFYEFGMVYASGADGEPDYRAAMDYLRAAAEDGHGEAARKVGLMYQDGFGVDADAAEAAKWYRKAMDLGDIPAANLLGTLYDLGLGVPQNSYECIHLYRSAAERGSMKAVNNLGYMYEHGRGVKKDTEEAIRLYRKAAEAGVQRAAKHLGELGLRYAAGKGLPKDYSRAADLLKSASEYGDLSVAPLLAAMYETGKGPGQDYFEAYRWYRLSGWDSSAADVLKKVRSAGMADEMYVFGLKLLQSEDIPDISGSAPDDAEGLFRAAADLGHSGASDMLTMFDVDFGEQSEPEEPLNCQSEAEQVENETSAEDDIKG